MVDTIIWFNLFVIMNGQVRFLGSYETLEECQAIRATYEETDKQGDYHCKWVRMERA